MRKKTNTTQRIRALIDSGYNNKAIIEKLKCKPQAVYNIRYQLNKQRGLGSIGELPQPTDGIGAPRKARTGIMKTPKPLINPAQNVWQFTPEPKPMAITMIEPPTLWQRIKAWFRG